MRQPLYVFWILCFRFLVPDHFFFLLDDCILGVASRTYDQERVQIGDPLPHLEPLKKFFPYFRSMNDVASRNLFTDYEGTTHFILGSRGGIQGDPIEMTSRR